MRGKPSIPRSDKKLKGENMNNETLKRVVSHGDNLKAFFNLHEDTLSLTICRKLRYWEKKAHALTTERCNGTNKTEEQQNAEDEHILSAVDKILNFKAQNIPVFINGDARGYALKIHLDSLKNRWLDYRPIFQDMGGYGIIAPDFSEGG